ncbi:MAG TPA: hypothetical protein VEL75_08980 [Candidatus Methylomirabilis sp.]|nr:hypothetical protein [Candidatus Methylomirabilis sp.]
MRALVYVAILLLLVIAVVNAFGRRRGGVTAEPRVRRDELVKDPVCQTYIVLSRAVKTEADGEVTHFCSRECAARYARGERRR